MAFTIADPELEARLEALGGRQPAPVTKTAMTRAILLRAVEAAERAGEPLAWMPAAGDMSVPGDSTGRTVDLSG